MTNQQCNVDILQPAPAPVDPLEAEMTALAPTGLRDNANFMRLWTAQVVSVTGSAVTLVAFPIIAVVILHAGPQQMGFLIAAGTAPRLLLRLPGAAWADARSRPVPMLITCDIASGLLLTAVPALWLVGSLKLGLLTVVAGALSAVAVVGEVFAGPLLPTILRQDQLVDGYAKFSVTRGLAGVTGPSLGGLLIKVLSAPVAVLADAASFFGAALLTRKVRLPCRPATRDKEQSSSLALTAGFAAIFRKPFLRTCVAAIAYLSFANGVVSALLVIYMVRTLGLAAAMVGPIIGAGAFGGVIGSISAAPLYRRLGPPRLAAVAIAVLTWSMVLLPVARPGAVGALACVNYELAGSFGAALLLITLFSEIPARVATETIARAMAVASLVPEGTALAGALLGGTLATHLGARHVLGGSVFFVLLADTTSALILIISRRAFTQRAK